MSDRLRWTALWVLLLAALLLPFVLFDKQFEHLANWLANGNASRWYTAAAIGGLLALDVFLPVPSSIVSTGAGAMLGFWRGAAVIWIGMTAGCMVGYLVGAKGAAAARRLVGDDGLARAARLMEQYGPWAVVLCRPIPVLAEASTVFAGLGRTPLTPYLMLTSGSNLGIAAAYAAVGAFSMQMESFLLTFLGALALPGLALVAGKLWLGRRGGVNRRE